MSNRTLGPTVAVAVSGHGFGHAVRSAEVARALWQRGARVLVRTDAPAWLFPAEVERMPSPGWPLDVGVAQRDGLDLDIDATRRLWADFSAKFDERADAEARSLREHKVDVLLGDIPPLAFASARRAGIPSLALGNFGWDWIYGAWPDFHAAIETVQTGYGCADGLLRLPLHSPAADAFPAFTQIEDVPLIGRYAQRSRAQVRDALRLPRQALVVLLSFGGFAAHGLDVAALGQWGDYVFVLTPPLAPLVSPVPANVLVLAETPTDYVSLLGACDVVVTKPGYGVVADCLANRVAVLYTDRGPFREYEVLTQALPKLGQARFVPREVLLAGRLGPDLDALLETRTDWSDLPMDGAQQVAERVLQRAPGGQ